MIALEEEVTKLKGTNAQLLAALQKVSGHLSYIACGARGALLQSDVYQVAADAADGCCVECNSLLISVS